MDALLANLNAPDSPDKSSLKLREKKLKEKQRKLKEDEER